MDEKYTISVIMGIYNCADTLDESIESLLAQTYDKWVLIMCDDGSKDNTYGVAKKYADKDPERFILLKNEKNMGLNYTLNKCLAAAKTKYIARQDGDDVSLPERFEKEIEILENNPDIAIVSTGMLYFDANGDWGSYRPNENPTKKSFIHGTPFCHAPCMVRREAYNAVGGYTEAERLLRNEDYHLWIKMYKNGYRGVNIPDAYYKMRDDNNAYNRRKYKYRINEAYVKFLAFKELKLPFYTIVFVVKPLIVGLLPKPIYKLLHKKKLNAK
ncbi:MAG: glycosyltransferase [Clostridia bacterium]|nr:glycosyltransferase [Clostridia bacterium]